MNSYDNDKKASLACWTIKRALESIDAPVTVYAFDDQSEVAYKRDEKAHKTQYKFIFGDGGTHPYKSLLAAEQLFISSRRKNKMLFIITDGVFDKNQNDEVIERIAKRGVLTANVLIMTEKEMKWHIQHNYIKDENDLGHGAEVFGRVNSAADLVPFAKAVVTGAIRKRSRIR
jgi:crotonobetainyl-CoA:carnitine CoA-transferase CaiB-like acyl-CoA transferase